MNQPGLRFGGTERTWPGLGAILVAAGAFGLIDGVVGASVGVGLILVWLTFPPTFAFAFAQIAFFTLFAGDVTTVQFGVFETLFFVILVSSTFAFEHTVYLASGAVSFLLLLSSIVLASQEWFDRTWMSAAVLLGTVGILTYGVHRYEVLHTRVIEANNEQ